MDERFQEIEDAEVSDYEWFMWCLEIDTQCVYEPTNNDLQEYANA